MDDETPLGCFMALTACFAALLVAAGAVLIVEGSALVGAALALAGWLAMQLASGAGPWMEELREMPRPAWSAPTLVAAMLVWGVCALEAIVATWAYHLYSGSPGDRYPIWSAVVEAPSGVWLIVPGATTLLLVDKRRRLGAAWSLALDVLVAAAALGLAAVTAAVLFEPFVHF